MNERQSSGSKHVPVTPSVNVPDIERYSLLLRYNVLFSGDSPVRLDKVSFDGHEMDGGLKAIEVIPAGIPILATASSTASDVIPDQTTGISIIETHPCQIQPVGVRLLLGAFRFANHDCNPNCQVKGKVALSCSKADAKFGIATPHQGFKCIHLV